MSGIERFREFWGKFGYMFGGRRNMYDVFGWKPQPDYKDFIAKYRRQGIAKRIIDAPVDGLWSDPPELEADEAFMAAWKALLTRIPVFHAIQRLDKLASLGRYAVMIVGFDDGQSLENPVNSKEGRQVLYLQPYLGEKSVSIEKFVESERDPRFGLPELYNISTKIDETITGVSSILRVGRSFRVHHSRVIHVAEGGLETNVFGHSRLECVHNELDDITKVSGGAAETYWLAGNRGMHVNIDKEMDMDATDETNLTAELTEYQHELRRFIRTRGVEINSLGSDIADPSKAFAVLLSLISAATGIPKRVLEGTEAGQLSSQQDRANWADHQAERIYYHAEPIILMPFLSCLINAGVLPQPTNLQVHWPDAFKMNPLERAQTSAQMARSASNLLKALETQENINQSMAMASKEQQVQTGVDPNTNEPITETKPALMPARPPIQVITDQEARNIIGFGKHAPVFDQKSDSETPALETTATTDTAPAAPTGGRPATSTSSA